MVHRTSDSCYVWTLSADQQANVHNHTIYLEYEQLMRDKVAGGDTGTAMTAGDAPDFVAHHCHNKNLFSLS
ncbi:hypothetical protein BaRGS_00013214 [Batillaria attramentaria]|uniref:Uncharacterized protein n=1 Tax=Batillaria attramentaria TaxID=370345 RepID=A0ABD0L8C7_9CAEN